MKKDFKEWLNEFKYSISGYDYYVDFEKVYNNIDKIKVELNILNSLIGSKNIEQDFETIITKYPETLSCIPILLAVRQLEIYAQDEDGEYTYDFRNGSCSILEYKNFMKKTGLFDLLQNHIINNLVDYCLGVEVGLDSNGRKNRGGHQMENLVEKYIQKSGAKEYYKEMYLTEVEQMWNVDLSALSANGTSTKRFDFVVKTMDNIYLIETNFYGGNSGGSKLNETARSYEMLARKAENIPGVTFVWITDGTAWKCAKRNLEETFNVTDKIFNLHELENGVLSDLFNENDELLMVAEETEIYK